MKKYITFHYLLFSYNKGLLLFSQSGVVAKKIINNNNEEKVEKEYVAVVEKLDFKTSDRFKVNKW